MEASDLTPTGWVLGIQKCVPCVLGGDQIPDIRNVMLEAASSVFYC